MPWHASPFKRALAAIVKRLMVKVLLATLKIPVALITPHKVPVTATLGDTAGRSAGALALLESANLISCVRVAAT